MLSFQILGTVHAAGEAAWLKGKLRYINEAFMTDFNSPDHASAFIRTYEDDAALQIDMPFDSFVELHEQGDACVIIDRFVILDRNAYMQAQAGETAQDAPYCCLSGMPFALAASY